VSPGAFAAIPPIESVAIPSESIAAAAMPTPAAASVAVPMITSVLRPTHRQRKRCTNGMNVRGWARTSDVATSSTHPHLLQYWFESGFGDPHFRQFLNVDLVSAAKP
jgi:hypothetical protein